MAATPPLLETVQQALDTVIRDSLRTAATALQARLPEAVIQPRWTLKRLVGWVKTTLVPQAIIKGRTVIVQGDTEFGTVDFLKAVRQRRWRAVVSLRNSRLLQDGRRLKDLPGNTKRGLQVSLKDIDFPLTVSWFWLKRADDKRELRFVASTHPYLGADLVRLGRKRWAIVELALLAEWAFSKLLSISLASTVLGKVQS